MLTADHLRAQLGTPGLEVVADARSASSSLEGGGLYAWTSGALADDGDRVIVPVLPGAQADGAWVRQGVGQTHNVLTFGARGDGRTNDTRAIQRALDAVRPGDTVLVPARTFLVDPNHDPYRPTFGGLRVRSGTTLLLSPGSTLRAIGSPHGNSAVVSLLNASNVVITGGGCIEGERHRHRGQGGEWGFGIAVWGSRNVVIRNVEVKDCYGDGIYIGVSDRRQMPQSVRVSHCRLHGHRRMGVTIAGATDVTVEDCVIERIAGAAPSAGIDLEPDLLEYLNRRVRLLRNTISECEIAVAISHSDDVQVLDSTLSGRHSGIIFANNVTNLVVQDTSLRSEGRPGGSALFGLVDQPGSTRGVRVTNCQMSGGQDFVVNVMPAQNVVLEDNRIVANGPTLRLVRFFGPTAVFRRNTLTKEGPPRPRPDYIAHFHEVELGGNVFRNTTRARSMVIGAKNRNVRLDTYPTDVEYVSNE